MPISTIKDLKDALDLGSGIVTRIWDYKTKDWVTSVFAEDIDNDGNIEIIACTRDGRIHALMPKGTDYLFRWKRIIGTKAWVSTAVASTPPFGQAKSPACIIVGTQDGKVFMLDKDGRTVSRDGKTFPYDAESGLAIDEVNELKACWFDTKGHAIRQISIDVQSSTILIASEDRYIYGLDYTTGELRWKYQTGGWVRTVFSCDIDGDGQNEVLAGSVDHSLYILDQQGRLLDRYAMHSPIYTISATDVDRDGCIEIFVTTEDKDLIALIYHRPLGNDHSCFEQKWRKTFANRILSFCVADIDGDGTKEIIAASEDKHIYILNTRGDTIWRHNHKFRVFSIFPCDIDNNGLPELLVGSEDKRVRSMRIILKRDTEKKVRHHYHQLQKTLSTEIIGLTTDQHAMLRDILRTKNQKLVSLQLGQTLLTAEKYEQALSTLLQLEQQKVEQRWRKNTVGKVRSIGLRHFADGRKQEIIVGTYEGSIHALQANGRLSWSAQLNDHIVEVQTGFISHHKHEEIVTCTTDHCVYVLSGTKKPELRDTPIEESWISSICVTDPDRPGNAEIIVGSENRKLSIYRGDPLSLTGTISIEEGVRIVRAHTPVEEYEPEIFTASLTNHVFAYTRKEGQLEKPHWEYKTRDRIKAIATKDINSDGKVEVLIGSEDRNIHVLDNTGNLLWRYYLPHSILTIDAIDSDSKIFVGCANGLLYVFNREGDLLWTYEAGDRIRAVRAGDIDADGNIEIAVGAEDDLELLRIVNQRELSSLITHCWSALQQNSTPKQAIEKLLMSSDPLLQVFALSKLAALNDSTPQALDTLEQFAREGTLEVRKALARIVMTFYLLDPPRANLLLSQLWVNSEQSVRDAMIEHINILFNYDRKLALYYLWRATEDFDRFGRRMVVRKLHELIDSSIEKPLERPGEIFRLLLTAAQDSESEWVRQEAARTLAHFLNRHHGSLMVYMHLFIVKSLRVSVLRHIEHAATIPIVKQFAQAVIAMLEDLNEHNVAERLQQVIQALGAASNLIYGKDLLQIYTELRRLVTIETLAEIANYQCELKKGQFDAGNKFAPIILEVFERVSTINRPLKMYVRRENIHDRLASLLEAIEILERLPAFVEEKYATSIADEPITRLPDHQVFILLLAKWRKLVMVKLNELRGKAELVAQLQPQEARKEEQTSIWLTVRNIGRSSASDVIITLMHNELFEIVGNNTFETESILPQDETTPEFTLKPNCETLKLQFEIVYKDIDGQTKIEDFEDILTLRESSQKFRDIPNPYSSGVPLHDSRMFYGREKDMAFLCDNLTRDARSVVVLYGQRRSGKTTVLLQFINSSTAGNAIPVLIDMQGISYEIAIDTFLHGIAYAIAESMAQKNLPISSPTLGSFTVNSLHTFKLFLNEVEKQLAGRKLILLIDEFEVLEEQVNMRKLQPEIFEYLRDIVQHRQSINFLFAGTHKITEHTKWYRSVFFHIAIHHQLLRLSTEGAEALIQKPVEGFLEYEPHAVKKIHLLTGDQPYLIHLICRAIVDYCNEREKTFVTINDVNTVLHDVMQTGHFHFDWLWDQIKPEVRVALAAISEGGREEGRWLSLSELREIYRHHSIPFKREYVLSALKTLLEADIIEKTTGDTRRGDTLESNRFRILVGLTRTWLLKEHPLEQTIMEMSD